MKEIQAWAARDEDGKLFLYLRKPKQIKGVWLAPGGYIKLDNELFPEIKWSDKEPTKVKITIEK